jgi:hypothetical protein
LPTEAEVKRLARYLGANSKHGYQPNAALGLAYRDFWTSTITGLLRGSAKVFMGSSGEVQSLDQEDLAHARCVLDK